MDGLGVETMNTCLSSRKSQKWAQKYYHKITLDQLTAAQKAEKIANDRSGQFHCKLPRKPNNPIRGNLALNRFRQVGYAGTEVDPM